jgi:hypothetical protein
MPFVLQERKVHIAAIEENMSFHQGECDMNWVFDTYSNVYTTAMMQTKSVEHHAATAKERAHGKRTLLFGFLGRR